MSREDHGSANMACCEMLSSTNYDFLVLGVIRKNKLAPDSAVLLQSVGGLSTKPVDKVGLGDQRREVFRDTCICEATYAIRHNRVQRKHVLKGSSHDSDFNCVTNEHHMPSDMSTNTPSVCAHRLLLSYTKLLRTKSKSVIFKDPVRTAK
jgi:hypothetical protein